MAKNKSITLCADDYALSHGVSVGILEALRAGRLSAVSALTNGPRWPALGRDLARGEFDADVGLHLNLTLGAPLEAMPKFAPKGAFPPVSRGDPPLGARASCRWTKSAPRSTASSTASRR